jgi:hypothetical protein
MDEINLNHLYLKFGLYYGAQIVILVVNSPCLLRANFGKLPFFIQMVWLLNCATWNYGLMQPKSLIIDIASGILDCLAKSLVIYFLSIRILIVEAIVKINQGGWKLFLCITLSVLILGNYSQLLEVYQIPDAAMILLNSIYYSHDVLISLIEIYTVWLYLKIKYDLKDNTSVLRKFKDLKLFRMGIVIVFFALLNTVTYFLNIFSSDFDPDLNYNGMLACIKYHYACSFTIDLFIKTTGSITISSELVESNSGEICKSSASMNK